jgi:hypothetical protein
MHAPKAPGSYCTMNDEILDVVLGLCPFGQSPHKFDASFAHIAHRRGGALGRNGCTVFSIYVGQGHRWWQLMLIRSFTGRPEVGEFVGHFLEHKRKGRGGRGSKTY